MISKRIQPNRNGKISYTNKKSTANVVNYIANKAIEKMTNYVDKTTKTWYINLPQDKELAIVQMQSTQARNDTNSSKIYHYVVSLNHGEQPSDNIMLDIEKTISENLGFKEYQRVLAIHNDTNNYHMHIVINTIHPTKFINHNSPSNDYYIRDKKMRELEQKYNLSVDNGIENRNTQELKNYKAIDFESHTGLESFTTYLKKEIKETALNIQNWQELHNKAKKIGVIVKLKANGLVFKSINSKITVKASSVDRKLSKLNLEKKLGSFIEYQTAQGTKNGINAQQRTQDEKDIQNHIQRQKNAIQGTIEHGKIYTPKPLHKNNDELWKKYLEKKKNHTLAIQDKKEVLNKLFEVQSSIIKDIWINKDLAYTEKKHLQHQLNIINIKNKYNVYSQNLDSKIKLIYDKARDKFIQLEVLKYENLKQIQNKFLAREEKIKLAQQANQIYINALTQLKSEIKKEIMHNKHNPLSWVDFLRQQAKTNSKAIEILQSIELKQPKEKANQPYIAGVKIDNILIENAKISKNGTIVYKTNDGGIFTDEKNKITIVKDSKEAQEQSYKLAQQQFKHTMSIRGNLEYWNKQQSLER